MSRHRKETLTKNGGYTWFKFDYVNWLTSEDVLAMTVNEEGYFIRALATQANEGFLWANPTLLARQMKRDRRGVLKFMIKWGHLFAMLQQDCNNYGAMLQQGCYNDVPTLLHMCSKVVEPKLFNLSVEQAKTTRRPSQDKEKRLEIESIEEECKYGGKGSRKGTSKGDSETRNSASTPSPLKAVAVAGSRKAFSVAEDEL